MRTIRVLSFFAGDKGFAADVALVHKIARKINLTPVPAAAREVAGIANLKGKVVTILNTAALFEPSKADKPKRSVRAVNAVIFAPSEGGLVGLLVDRLGDFAEIDGAADVSEVADIGGVSCRMIDIDFIIGRFGDGGAVSDRRGGTDNVNEENV